MKFLVLLLLTLTSSFAWALKLTYVGETAIANATKFEGTVIGGLSGLAFHEGKLFALSDDRGKFNDERFYEFQLAIDKSKVTLTPTAVHFIKDLPKTSSGKKPGLDPEGLARLPDGSFLISSEGTNDAKPRVMPRIFHVSATGKWMADLPIPSKYLPEEVGQQTKGIQNNLAFEGLTALPDGKTAFAGIEKALQQDVVISEEDKGDYIRVLKYTRGEEFKVAAEYAYQIDALALNDDPKEFFRGVSEILAVSDSKLLVLERGAKISAKKLWTSTVGIYLADFGKATDVSAMEKLDLKKITPATKIKLIDFEKDLAKLRPGKSVDNFEAVAWGPTLPDGRRTLLIMSDDNFSKKQTTELLVFAVEGE